MNQNEVIHGQAGLAGIQELLNGRTARKLIRDEIADMLPTGTRIGRLNLTRSKYRPGRKLSAFYTFTIQSPVDDAIRTMPVAVTWEADFSPSDSEVYSPLQAETAQHHLLAPFSRLISERSEWGLRVRIWPLDPEFHQLPRICDPAYCPQFFRSAKVATPDGDGTGWRITPVRYRPGERHVLRFDLLQSGQPTRMYAKLYRDAEGAARAYRTANRAVYWLNEHTHEFRGVQAAGWSPEDAVVIYPHVAGTPISHRLSRSSRWIQTQMRTIGIALSLLHDSPPEMAAELDETTLEDEIHATQRACEHIRDLLPSVGNRIEDILERVQDLYCRLPGEEPTFTHSDFKADHLLADRSGLTLIDFDTCSRADPALDIGKFLADLDWWYGFTGAPGCEDAHSAFLDGYSEGNENPRQIRARVFEALILIKITARRAPIHQKGWEELTTRLIAKAGRVIRRVESIK